MEEIFNELRIITESLDPNAEQIWTSEIIACKGKIIGLGAGRMGYAMQSFIMRLSHLGYRAYMIGDTTLPKIGAGDLVLVNSSSGETQSVCLLAQIAKDHGARVVVLTAGRGSRLDTMSDVSVFYRHIKSKQLMKTLCEQFTFLFFDWCAFQLARVGKLSINEIETNHSILE